MGFTFPQGQTVSSMNYDYNCRLTATLDANQQPVAFALDFSDGRRAVYGCMWNSGRFYMSSSVDQQGFVTQYNYGTNNDGNLYLGHGG